MKTGRPKSAETMQHTAIVMPAELKEEIHIAAIEDERSWSSEVRYLLRQALRARLSNR